MDNERDQMWAGLLADEARFKKTLQSNKKRKPMEKTLDPLRPKTIANWIPAAIPPTVENRYLVWIRQNGSILQGRQATFWYYPNSAVWEPTFKLAEGEQVDMWADVVGPFWQESPGPTNLDRPAVTNLDKK